MSASCPSSDACGIRRARSQHHGLSDRAVVHADHPDHRGLRRHLPRHRSRQSDRRRSPVVQFRPSGLLNGPSLHGLTRKAASAAPHQKDRGEGRVHFLLRERSRRGAFREPEERTAPCLPDLCGTEDVRNRAGAWPIGALQSFGDHQTAGKTRRERRLLHGRESVGK